MALAGAQGPTIRRSSLMRYKTLWEGSNQVQADGLLSLERVLWEQAQPDHATVGASVFRESDPRSEPEADTELETLTHQFRQLQNEIRDTLEDNEGPRPLLPRDDKDAVSVPPSPELKLRPPAVEPRRTFEDIGREFAGLRDSLHGCVQSTKPTHMPTPGRRALTTLSESPSSIPVPRRAPGFTSELKPRLPFGGGGAYRPTPAAESSTPLPRPAFFRGMEPSLHGAAPPAELGNLAVCSLVHSNPSPNQTPNPNPYSSPNLNPNANLNLNPNPKPDQVCSLRGVEQILAAAEARRAAAEAEAEVEAGAPRLNLSPAAVAASLLSRVGAFKQGELLAVPRSLCPKPAGACFAYSQLRRLRNRPAGSDGDEVAGERSQLGGRARKLSTESWVDDGEPLTNEEQEEYAAMAINEQLERLYHADERWALRARARARAGVRVRMLSVVASVARSGRDPTRHAGQANQRGWRLHLCLCCLTCTLCCRRAAALDGDVAG